MINDHRLFPKAVVTGIFAQFLLYVITANFAKMTVRSYTVNLINYTLFCYTDILT